MGIKFKIGVAALVTILGLSVVTSGFLALATEIEQENRVSLYNIEEETDTIYDSKQDETATIQITDDVLIINGEAYNQEKLESLLATAEEIGQASNGGRQKRFAAAAGVYFIPGIGQVALAATGAIVLGGITIGAGHWAYSTIKNYFENNKSSGPVGKENRKKQGREVNEKKKKNGWKSNSNKKTNRPMKKHTPGRGHKKGAQ